VSFPISCPLSASQFHAGGVARLVSAPDPAPTDAHPGRPRSLECAQVAYAVFVAFFTSQRFWVVNRPQAEVPDGGKPEAGPPSAARWERSA
jgi:hypothetical protein